MPAYNSPTKLQIDLINSIKFIVGSWTHTNDFSSPTHFIDITEELKKYRCDGMTDEFNDQLIGAVEKILKLIQDANKHIDKIIED